MSNTFIIDKPSDHPSGFIYPTPSAPPPKTLANPGPLGLFCFSISTFVLSMYTTNVRGINQPNIIVGLALFCGGVGQIVAGIFEFPRGNAFSATAFISYGTFWMSFAAILLPSTGIVAAFKSKAELNSALAIYLSAWTMVTFLFAICTFRTNLITIGLFTSLTITFGTLTVGHFFMNTLVNRVGGGAGIMTALFGYYLGFAELLAADPNSVFNLPVGVIRKRRTEVTV